jgi:hypothetical protein
VAITRTPVTFRSSREKLLRALESRRLLPFDPTSRGMPFLAWLSSERVAPWALGVASKVVLSTVQALPAGHFRDVTALFLREFSLQASRCHSRRRRQCIGSGLADRVTSSGADEARAGRERRASQLIRVLGGASGGSGSEGKLSRCPRSVASLAS